MARGNPEFCKMETDFILTDPRFALMSGDEVKVYFFLWATAVHERRETPKSVRDLQFLAKRVQMTYESCTDSVRKLSKSPLNLIRVRHGAHGTCSITVIGVREKHKQLEWKDDPVHSPNGDDSGRRVEESRGEKSRGEKSTPPPPPESPFDSIVLPQWKIWSEKKWVKPLNPGTQAFDLARKEVNRDWNGKYPISGAWLQMCAEMEIAHFIHEDWHFGPELLTRKNDKGRLLRDELVGGTYRLSKRERAAPSGGKPAKPEFLQVGDEYNNVARKVEDDEPEDQ